jgi:hypothetical protein
MGSELLLLLEEQAEADDSAVNQQSSDYAHDHSGKVDQFSVCENDR